MNPNRKKDYFAGVTTTLTPYRHHIVKEIANRLCASRDELTSGEQPRVKVVLWNKGTPKPFYIHFEHSNDFIYETVNDILPTRLKGLCFILDVLAGEIEGRRNRVYEYPIWNGSK